MVEHLKSLHHAGEYLVAIPLILTVLSLAGGRTKATMAKLMGRLHSFGFLMPARLVYVVGIAIFVMSLQTESPRSITEPFILVGLILWIPIEIVAKRLVKAELAAVHDGGEASARLTIGVVVEFVLITLIVVAMEHGH